MDNIVLLIIAAVLFVTWLLTPILIIQYRRYVVPWRYDEIREQFVKGVPLDKKPVAGDRGKTAAWHYARLQNPAGEVKDGETALRAAFDHYHAPNRYSVPGWMIVILSALMLVLIGLWVSARLQGRTLTADEVGSPSTNAIVKAGAVDTNAAHTANEAGQPAGPPKKLPPARAGRMGLIDRIDDSIIMAILGAIVWSLYEILSRRRTGDLTPIELYDVVNRFVTAALIGYTFSLLVFDKVSPWLAFVASAFPLRDIRQLIRKQALRKLGEFEKLGMPCALDVCEFYVQHCWDLKGNRERDNWCTNPTVIELARRLEIPVEILVLQMLYSVFSDPHAQFLIRAWFGPATSEDEM